MSRVDYSRIVLVGPTIAHVRRDIIDMGIPWLAFQRHLVVVSLDSRASMERVAGSEAPWACTPDVSRLIPTETRLELLARTRHIEHGFADLVARHLAWRLYHAQH